MLKFPCLVLDHDDTIVQSEGTVNYPFFVEYLKEYRPGMSITLDEYVSGCFEPGYIEMCRQKFGFNDEELLHEYNSWKAYIATHTPAPYPGVERIIKRQKEEGGILCVSSQSSDANILRDYRVNSLPEPDLIFGWEFPPEQRKPSPWPLEQIMKTFGMKPEELLVVDDLKPGYDMAKAAGVPFAAAGWANDIPQIEQFMRTNCGLYFKTVGELSAYLFGVS